LATVEYVSGISLTSVPPPAKQRRGFRLISSIIPASHAGSD
jgi:hypothetical protein